MSYIELEEPALVCHLASCARLIACGIDSEVFHSGEVVVKHYKVGISDGISVRQLTPKNLEDYYELTNSAAQFSQKNQLKVHLFASKKDIPVVITPILRMQKCDKCGDYEGTAPYVAGPTAEGKQEIFDPKELRMSLASLATSLEEQFGFSGIVLDPANVKIADNDSFIITDLCSDIRMLRKTSI